MPTSHHHQLNELMEVILLVDPTSVLDVGTGLGKFGVLSREYLEVRRGHLRKQDWHCQIDGIEGFGPYLSPLHEYVYDHLFTGDVRQIIPGLTTHYDLILLIDVLEHFEYQAGLALLTELLRHTDNLLVSTPKRFVEQGASFGNRLEVHHSHWGRRDFSTIGEACFIPNEVSLICLVGQAAGHVRREVFSWRRRLKRQAPFLAAGYHAIKALYPAARL